MHSKNKTKSHRFKQITLKLLEMKNKEENLGEEQTHQTQEQRTAAALGGKPFKPEDNSQHLYV
jgi:hypothetical protein